MRCARIGCTSKRRQHGLLQSRRAGSHDAVHPRLRYIDVCVDPSSNFRVIDIRRIPKEVKIEQKKNILQEPIHSVSTDFGNSSARAAGAGYFAESLVEDRKSVFDGRALLDFLWAAKDLIGAAFTFASFGDGEKRRIKRMPENRKNSPTALMVNRVVFPFARHYAAAIYI